MPAVAVVSMPMVALVWWIVAMVKAARESEPPVKKEPAVVSASPQMLPVPLSTVVQSTMAVVEPWIAVAATATLSNV